jgi:hypothetical protein
MKLVRAMFLLLAVTLPTSWTLAHAADEAPAGGEMKDAKPKKKGKKKKDEGGDKADKGGDADKK